MYYVWRKDTRLTKKFAHFRKEPAGYKAADWISGAELKSAPPNLTLLSDAETPQALSDLLLTSAQLQVFSPRLVKVLASLGATNLQYFPVTIQNQDTGARREDYVAANIVGK